MQELDPVCCSRSLTPRLRLSLLTWASVVVSVALGTNAVGQTPASSLAPPAHFTSEQDHQRTLDLLHIAALRRGPDGDPKSPNAANVDENKVRPNLTLPDPLVLKNGNRVKTARMWWTERRPQIVEDFDQEIYGRVPKITPKVIWQVTGTSREMSGEIPVITKNLVGHVNPSSYSLGTVDI